MIDTRMVALMLVVAIAANLGMAHDAAAASNSLPKGISLSFTKFSEWPDSAINCSIDGATGLAPNDVCTVVDDGAAVVLSGPDEVVSARYQYARKVQLWSGKHVGTRAVSFSTSYVVQFNRNGDWKEAGVYWTFGGGLAFAITPDQRVGSSGPESLGLFEIDPKTGNSLRGKQKTKTVAVELDISRGSADVTFPDPAIPHVGLDIDTVRSVATSPIGNFTTFVDRRIAVFVDYDAKARRLDVRVQKLSGSPTSRSFPDKAKSKLYISYSPLRLSDLVNERSYVGFSTRAPIQYKGTYVLRSWNFSTNWVAL